MDQDINNLAIKLTNAIDNALIHRTAFETDLAGQKAIPSYYNVREIIYNILIDNTMILKAEQKYTLQILEDKRMSLKDLRKYEETKMSRMIAEEIFKNKEECLLKFAYETEFYKNYQYKLLIMKSKISK